MIKNRERDPYTVISDIMIANRFDIKVIKSGQKTIQKVNNKHSNLTLYVINSPVTGGFFLLENLNQPNLDIEEISISSKRNFNSILPLFNKNISVGSLNSLDIKRVLIK